MPNARMSRAAALDEILREVLRDRKASFIPCDTFRSANNVRQALYNRRRHIPGSDQLQFKIERDVQLGLGEGAVTAPFAVRIEPVPYMTLVVKEAV